MTESTATRHKRFKEALEAFSRSPRFALFKGVQVGRLMPEGCQTSQEVSELSFEQLVEQAHTVGSPAMPLSAEQEDELYHLLIVLSEDNESAILAPDDDISVVIPDSFGSIDIPTLDEQLSHSEEAEPSEPPSDVPVGSVPLELALRASLAKIVSHKGYPAVRKRTLAEFWDPSWTPAPFEEAMSIEQFAGLDLAVLFKKRMVTDTRIQSILRALSKVQSHLDAAGEGHAALPQEPAPPRVSTTLSVPVESGHPLPHTGESCSPFSISRLAVMEALAGAHEGPALMVAIRRHFSVAECAGIALGEVTSKRAFGELRRIVQSALTAPERELVEALLRAPAVRIEHIARALFGPNSTITARTLCLAAIAARGLGAVPVPSRRASEPEFWTLAPKQLEQLLGGDTSGKAKRSSSTQTLMGRQHLDPYLQQLERAQGEGKSSRKERRNRLNNRRRNGR
jgi:hypothetical protein